MSGSAYGGAQPQARPIHTGGLEPLAMLQALRGGRSVVNPHWQRPAQFLPQGLPAYTPPVLAQAPVMPSGLYGPGSGGIDYGNAGPGVGAGDGIGATGVGDSSSGPAGAAAAGAAASGDGGGGGGGSK